MMWSPYKGRLSVAGRACWMPGEALVVSAVWLAWFIVLLCCSPVFFLADPVFFFSAARCPSLQRLGGWRAFCRDWLT
jgi:hypothetical protein